ncbi:MAG: hypothetical protein C4538_10005 [Nitrospiraceae bacterium]|nr:MAG: hypothetical protein C4538_10005 [Nitrospiraceae bacterium]
MDRDMSDGVFDKLFSKLVSEEIKALINHELGEASQRRLLGRWWRDLLVKIPYGRAELFLRALKDVLSDTCPSGTLSYIITQNKTASLYFFIALHGGYRKIIFPEVVHAYEEFLRTGDWGLIEKARVEGYDKTKGYVGKLKELYGRGDVSSEIIEKELMTARV